MQRPDRFAIVPGRLVVLVLVATTLGTGDALAADAPKVQKVQKVQKVGAPAPAAPKARARVPLAPAIAKAACVAPKPGPTPAFAPGERLEFEIDSLGALVGTLSLAVIPGRGREPWTLEARGRTGTFAANFYSVDAVAQSRLGRDQLPRSYFEDATYVKTRQTVDLAFPPGDDGRLEVRLTNDGNPRDFDLEAPADTRDILSTLFLARSLPLKDGDELCMPFYAQQRIWYLRGRIVGREPVRTPAGDFQTIHFEGVATRGDNPKLTREVHFWLTDDAARTPVAAFGLVQNKPVRAQLVRHEPGRRKVAAAPRR